MKIRCSFKCTQRRAEKSSLEQARTKLFIAPLWDCLKFKKCKVERRSVTSRYHGSKMSVSQQSFLKETAICIAERWIKSTGYHFFPERYHEQESHTCQCFRFFLPHLQEHSLFRSRHFATWRTDFSSVPTSMLRPRCASSTKQENNNNNGLTILMKAFRLQFTMFLQLSSFPSQHFISHKNSLVDQLVCFHYLQFIMGGMTKYENYLATFKNSKSWSNIQKKINSKCFLTSVLMISFKASSTSVKLWISTVWTKGLPTNTSAYGFWDVIWVIENDRC